RNFERGIADIGTPLQRVRHALFQLVVGYRLPRDVVGVKTVRNQLDVEPRKPVPDDELEQRVTHALQRSPYVGDTALEVTAVDGEVYLEGEADSWFERFEAGEVAAGITGVAEVHNNLDVS
ncbi:MAG TPA: BON domain-containing protein, partial [Woeseiaceae bacterium]|nr:BON domain-containing protein [Woeseiaceae bacterium]